MTEQPGIDIAAVLAAIADGRLDHHLPALADAINQRNRDSAAEQTRAALQHLAIGTRVRIDDHISPHYLRGRPGTIHHIDGTTVTVCLDTPIGRFTDGHVACSARVLHAITSQDR